MRARLTAVGVLGVAADAIVHASSAAAEVPGTGAIGEWATDGFFDRLSAWVASGFASIVEGLLHFLAQSSTPEPTALWFSGPASPYAAVRGVAAVLLVAFALLGVIHGLLAGDPLGMVRRIVVNVPGAVLAIVATTVVTTKLLALTDALSAAVLGPTLSQSSSPLAEILAHAVVTTGGAAGVLVGAMGVLAALAVWVELLVRSALVYVLVALSPLAFAASVWPAARGASRRLLELLLAVVLSKLVIAVALAVGASGLANAASPLTPSGVSTGADDLGAVIVGVAVLGLAAFAPFVVLRLFPFVEAAVVAHGVSRAPLRGVQAGASMVMTASSVSRLAGSASGAPRSAGGGDGHG